MTISIKDYTPEFIRKQRIEEIQAHDHDMTYKEALHISWELLESKRKETEGTD